MLKKIIHENEKNGLIFVLFQTSMHPGAIFTFKYLREEAEIANLYPHPPSMKTCARAPSETRHTIKNYYSSHITEPEPGAVLKSN